MGVWFKRAFVCSVVLFLVAILCAYLMASTLVETLLKPTLSQRNGGLRIASLDIGLSGVVVVVDRYEEPGLVAEDAQYFFASPFLICLGTMLLEKV